ncbi:TPA_asm: M [Rose alphacytorhabdovirus 1]|nr:TPA_asm: M [Rose alphacytorhabdovirus 1]
MAQLWICAAVYCNHAELALAKKKKVTDFPKGALRNGFIGLVKHLAEENEKSYPSDGKRRPSAEFVKKFVSGLSREKRITCVRDVGTSALFGQKTTRLHYNIFKMHIFPTDTPIDECTVRLFSPGIGSTISGNKVKAIVNITVNFSMIDHSKIDDLLKESPEWFCGDILDESE